MNTPDRLSLFGPAPLALLAALVLANPAAQTLPPVLVLTETNNGGIFEAGLQQPIAIHLRGNASTPYSWYFVGTNGTSVVPNGSSKYVPDSPGLPGSPGTFEFPFLAVGAGTTTLNFDEHRFGDPQNIVATFAVNIDVVVPQPVLSITLVGSDVLISWPNTTSTDFMLEVSSSPAGPLWAPANFIIRDDGTNYWVQIDHLGPSLFLRLQTPPPISRQIGVAP